VLESSRSDNSSTKDISIMNKSYDNEQFNTSDKFDNNLTICNAIEKGEEDMNISRNNIVKGSDKVTSNDNKNTYDIGQCNTTNVTCDKSDDKNLTNCDNANAIEEIREDTNVIVTKLNLSDFNSKNTNGTCTIYTFFRFIIKWCNKL